MSARVTDNSVQVSTMVTRNTGLGLRFLAEAIVRESTPRTPKDKGNLGRDVIKQVLGLTAFIQWRKVYAQYQEGGKRQDGSHAVTNYTTSGTGPHFAENAVRKVIAQAGKYFRQAGAVK